MIKIGLHLVLIWLVGFLLEAQLFYCLKNQNILDMLCSSKKWKYQLSFDHLHLLLPYDVDLIARIFYIRRWDRTNAAKPMPMIPKCHMIIPNQSSLHRPEELGGLSAVVHNHLNTPKPPFNRSLVPMSKKSWKLCKDMTWRTQAESRAMQGQHF